MNSKELIYGIVIGIIISLLIFLIIKYSQRGKIIELKRDNRGLIVEIMERYV